MSCNYVENSSTCACSFSPCHISGQWSYEDASTSSGKYFSSAPSPCGMLGRYLLYPFYRCGNRGQEGLSPWESGSWCPAPLTRKLMPSPLDHFLPRRNHVEYEHVECIKGNDFYPKSWIKTKYSITLPLILQWINETKSSNGLVLILTHKMLSIRFHCFWLPEGQNCHGMSSWPTRVLVWSHSWVHC